MNNLDTQSQAIVDRANTVEKENWDVIVQMSDNGSEFYSHAEKTASEVVMWALGFVHGMPVRWYVVIVLTNEVGDVYVVTGDHGQPRTVTYLLR